MMSGFTGLQKDEVASLQKGNEWTNSSPLTPYYTMMTKPNMPTIMNIIQIPQGILLLELQLKYFLTFQNKIRNLMKACPFAL